MTDGIKTAIIEQNDDTMVAANMKAGTLLITTVLERSKGSPEAAMADAMWLLRDGRIRDRRSQRMNAALLAAASILDRAVADEAILNKGA